ncbi:MAG: baeRF10 domain-containing protein [Anaerolineae bacterium]
MFDQESLRALVAFDGQGPILSVYLDTDLAHQPKDAVKLMLRDQVRSLDKQITATDLAVVNNYLDYTYDWKSRGLALFVAQGRLEQAVPLPVPVKTQVTLSDKVQVRTLADVLDRFGQYAVALYDQEGVRLFQVSWGRIESEEDSFGAEVKRHKQGGWAAAKYQRREDNLALRNLKLAVERTVAFCHEFGCRKLVLAGQKEVLSEVKELLPTETRALVVGEFAADMQIAPSELLSLSVDVAWQADLAEETRSVNEAITSANKGGSGVIGPDDTLQALHQGRVRRLLVDADYQEPGYVCGYCGHIADGEYESCPFCGQQEVCNVPDTADLAIRKAVQSGAEVDIVRENAELAGAGGMAAILRY